ncbi:MAG: helix-turn-helix domain-containing protein [Oscillospiraceae bacterium]|nr:helix-turn-helix domain-containing protein [Oscillospiraceae bacterium]
MKSWREYPFQATADFPFSFARRTRKKGLIPASGVHWHPELEILYMQTGRVEIHSSKHTFPLLPGQIAFIPAGEVHAVYGLDDAGAYDVMLFSLDLLTMPESHFFQQELILPMQSEQLRFPRLLTCEDDAYPSVRLAFEQVRNCPRESSLYKLTAFTSLIQIFCALSPRLERVSDDAPPKGNETVKACLRFMDTHYARRLTLREIADQVHLHPNYLCSLFKDYTGHTVFQHLIRIRVEKAAQLLSTQDITVTAAAAACGFDNTGFFTRKFRAIMGVTPKQFSILQQKERT